MQVSIPLNDFMTLLDAAAFGATKAAGGVKSPHTVEAWMDVVTRLSNMPLDDGRTQEQRDQSAHDAFAADCARYGSN